MLIVKNTRKALKSALQGVKCEKKRCQSLMQNIKYKLLIVKSALKLMMNASGAY